MSDITKSIGLTIAAVLICTYSFSQKEVESKPKTEPVKVRMTKTKTDSEGVKTRKVHAKFAPVDDNKGKTRKVKMKFDSDGNPIERKKKKKQTKF